MVRGLETNKQTETQVQSLNAHGSSNSNQLVPFGDKSLQIVPVMLHWGAFGDHIFPSKETI